MYEQKRSPTRRNYQVLRSTDASPRGVNCIFVIRRGSRGFAGLAPHSGRSSKSHSVVLCSGLWKTSLITTGPEGPHQDNRASIGKRRSRVNPFSAISLWKSGRTISAAPPANSIRKEWRKRRPAKTIPDAPANEYPSMHGTPCPVSPLV